MTEAPDFLKSAGRIFLTIPGLSVLIALSYFVYLYLEDESETSVMYQNTAIVAICSLGVLYIRKYLLTTYGKVSGFEPPPVPPSTTQPMTEFVNTGIPDKALGIPSF
mgnify:CR=1 FL=1